MGDESDKGALEASGRTHHSVGSTSRELEVIRDAEQEVTTFIQEKKRWMFLLLPLAVILAIVALGAVGGGIAKERDFIEEMNSSYSNSNAPMVSASKAITSIYSVVYV